MKKARIAIVLLLGISLVVAIPLGVLKVKASSETHSLIFSTGGCFPKHLPDSYIGEVALVDLDIDTIPDEVQGIYWWNGDEWLFWAPGAPGCSLSTMGGGHTFDYLMCVTGPCDWEIALSTITPTPTPIPSPTPLPIITMSCVEARDAIQDALNIYNTQYQEWPTTDGQPGDIEWTKLIPEFTAGVPSNDSLCDWWVNSGPKGEVCVRHQC